ncbi:MAG: hypothetical protein ABIS36_11930 [Chryseolinea sp.]
MSKNSKAATVVFSIYIVLSFYIFGGGVVNALVAYPTWRAVGPKEFVAFHQIDSDRIIPLFVVFFFMGFIPQILLFWFRPMAVTRILIWGALLLNSIVLISTVTIQIPIQNQLQDGFSLELINKLISTDLIFRRIPMICLAIINFMMLYKVVNRFDIS